jgi:hypothetical protein
MSTSTSTSASTSASRSTSPGASPVTSLDTSPGASKELVSLSPISIEPGRIELGRNVPANKVSIGASVVLAAGAAFAAANARWGWAVGLVAAAILLELNRRWMNRCRLVIERRHVRFTPLRGGKVVSYEEAAPSVDVYSWSPAEGGGLHHAARLRLSNPDIPDILIQEPLSAISNESAEREQSARRAESLRASLALGAAR